MTIYIFGNKNYINDTIALNLTPVISAEFPEIKLVHADPTEEFRPDNGSIIVDNVIGIKKVTVFKSLDEFKLFPQISVHDYDLLLHLQLLKKLGKIDKITIIGIPVGLKSDDISNEVISLIRKFLKGSQN